MEKITHLIESQWVMMSEEGKYFPIWKMCKKNFMPLDSLEQSFNGKYFYMGLPALKAVKGRV